ncbi:QUALITY PROTEIN: plant intracellular Ras-group-related LRR 9-like [Podarcis lilfordi]|uniref:QUALITY PROTEIN: plant intracellular Ras-group-related LRR 9-like n=1 Tax=Podarcis lilfordi TaxID=74358 RepID=A0AA35KK06_9SAUR|nr:QUALITY PROTEIN: plant intracellular Ras-group-related LRR 9-like [Podarcis lilfordi]
MPFELGESDCNTYDCKRKEKQVVTAMEIPTEHDPQYKGGKKLKLEGKELMSVPRQIFALQGLRVLEMTPERESCLRYRMDLVPREIGHLQNLAFLYLDSNNLKEVPAEIGSLGKLERLTLSNNSITSLPEEIGGLQKLHSLHLANNSLAELPAPVCQLRNLVFLDATDNHISTIPDAIQQLQKLETLLLLFNSLRHLPRGVCSLKALKTLWLGQNNLKALPSNFGQLEKAFTSGQRKTQQGPQKRWTDRKEGRERELRTVHCRGAGEDLGDDLKTSCRRSRELSTFLWSCTNSIMWISSREVYAAFEKR